MDAIIILAIVLGPPILAIVLYRRFNPTHRRAGVTPIGSSHIGIGALACSTCVGATAAGAAVMGAAALADVRWS
jgi:hypothetical protein